MHDVLIAGGGPAGLNAALILGRVRRPALVADSGQPRNAASAAMHGFLSRDGTDPAELRRVARQQLGAYPTVRVADATVESAAAAGDGFEVTLAGGEQAEGRRLLLATGLADELPEVEGLARLWGRAVYHCQYCDGWEARDQPVAVLGGDDQAAHLALGLARLGCDVVVCADGPLAASEAAAVALRAARVRVCEDLVARVDGEPGRYVRLSLSPGWTLERRAHPPRTARTERCPVRMRSRRGEGTMVPMSAACLRGPTAANAAGRPAKRSGSAAQLAREP